MFCNVCGNKLSPESRFCNRCGAEVQATQESPRRTPRPARRPPISPPRAVPRPIVSARPQEDEYELDPDDEAYEEEEESNEEEVIFQITPTFYPPGLAYFAAIVLSIALTAGAAYLGISLGIALAISALFFLYPIWMHIQNRRIVYTLTSIKVEIVEGIFSYNTRNIPLRHIQDVRIHESFKERLIGIGDVIIDSASMAGTITMNNIHDPRKHADMILDQLQYWR